MPKGSAIGKKCNASKSGKNGSGGKPNRWKTTFGSTPTDDPDRFALGAFLVVAVTGWGVYQWIGG